jgi:hypothetical protein
LVARASGRAEQTLFCSESLNQFAKFLARFEEGNSLRWHFDSGSGFWIASDARSSLARVEGPESTNFNFVSGSKGTDDAVEYSANDDVGFLPGHCSGLINLFGQICPGHLVYSLRQEKEYHRVTGASDSRLELRPRAHRRRRFHRAMPYRWYAFSHAG